VGDQMGRLCAACFLLFGVGHAPTTYPPPTTRPYDAPMLSSQFNSIRSPQLEGENARPHPGARLDGRCVGQLLSHLTYKGKENSSKQ
jgi:hypothetical protein